jgi:hypothetical protein
MSDDVTATAGRCKTCGRELVLITSAGEPVEAYHPADVLRQGETCAALLTIGTSSFLSLNVAIEEFEEVDPEI